MEASANMMDSRTNNLIDLHDNCFLCLRKKGSTVLNSLGENDNLSNESYQQQGVEDDKQTKGEKAETASEINLCKRYLKLISRYLKLPTAKFDVVDDSIDEKAKSTVFKRWEDLITGSFCTNCKKLAETTCDLMFKRDMINIELELKMRELEECIYFREKDSRSLKGRQQLHKTWMDNGIDPSLSFKLLNKLKDDILSHSNKKKIWPKVCVEQMADAVIIGESNPLSSFNNLKRKKTPSHRQSSSDDSGICEVASPPVSIPSTEGKSRISPITSVSLKDSTVRKQVAIRRVFTCKHCKEKFFNAQKLREHRLAAHLPTDAPKNPEKAVPTFGPRKNRVIKRVYMCPVEGCKRKFLDQDRATEHLKDEHPTPPENFNLPKADCTRHADIATDNNKADSVPEAYQYTCSIKGCNKTVNTSQELKIHTSLHQSHPCWFCKEQCQNARALAIHEFANHREPTAGPSNGECTECSRCDQVCLTIDELYTHFYTHLEQEVPSIKCANCDLNLITNKRLQQHMTECKGKEVTTTAKDAATEKNTIPATLKESDIPTDRNQDAPLCNPSSKYACNICSLPCISLLALRTHLIAGHDSNIQFCNDCDRPFSDVEALNMHRTIAHLKFKVYVCTHCDKQKTFKSLERFNRHVQRHKDLKEKKVQKDVVVSPSKRKRKYLQECSVCHIKFRNLKAHMRTHAAEGPSEAASEGSQESEANENQGVNDDEHELSQNNPVDNQEVSTSDELLPSESSASQNGTAQEPIMNTKNIPKKRKWTGDWRSLDDAALNDTLENSEMDDARPPKKRTRARESTESLEPEVPEPEVMDASTENVARTERAWFDVGPQATTSAVANLDAVIIPCSQLQVETDLKTEPVDENKNTDASQNKSLEAGKRLKNDDGVQNNETNLSTAKNQCNTEAGEQVEQAVEVNCVELSDDDVGDDDDNGKPDYKDCNVVLSQRVLNWLTGRNDPTVHEVDPDAPPENCITLD